MNDKTDIHAIEQQHEQAHGSRFKRAVGLGAVVAASLGAGFAGGTLIESNNESTPIEAAPETTSNKTDIQVALDQQQMQLDYLAGKLEDMTEILAAELGVKESTINGELLEIENFPGYENKVSPEVREQLETSVVAIGKRLKTNPESSWAQNCTANKVTFNGNTYVLSAAHCFSQDILMKGGGELSVTQTEASQYEYAVLDLSLPLEERVLNPIATSGLLSFNTMGVDTAILRFDQTTPAFEEVNALDLSKLGFSTWDMTGSEVALSAAPGSAGQEQISGTGIYLGSIANGYEIGSVSGVLHIVGIRDVEGAAKDACQYGASGSSGLVSDGTVLPSLSFRTLIRDRYEDNTPDGVDDTSDNGIAKLKIEDQLGINLDSFDVICGYAYPSVDVYTNLEAGLNTPQSTLSQGGK